MCRVGMQFRKCEHAQRIEYLFSFWDKQVSANEKIRDTQMPDKIRRIRDRQIIPFVRGYCCLIVSRTRSWSFSNSFVKRSERLH